MSVKITYDQLKEEFDLLEAVFESGRKEPFTDIIIRRAYAPGSYQPLSLKDRRRLIKGLPVRPTENPDESEYIAVITLTGYSSWHTSKVRDYVFKMRDDGCFTYNISYEYSRQPIAKWSTYIARWLNDIESFSGLRQQQRCRKIQMELMGRVFSLESD